MEILGGPLFSVAGAGESHGPGVTTIVYGCPAGLQVERAQVQRYLDRRRPGGNKLGTPRREDDQVAFLSGLYSQDHDALLAGPEVALGDGVQTPSYECGTTTGEPIAALVLSAAKRSSDYRQFAGPEGEVRPGHTDLVKHHKSQGFVDPRGGGRSSYRSTVSDVIGGSIARLFLQQCFGMRLFSSIDQVGPLKARRRLSDHIDELVRQGDGKLLAPEQADQLDIELESGPLHALDADFAQEAGELIQATRKQGDSLGSAIEVVATGVPALVGEPLYHSLKLKLMGILGGLHAVQSCEIGSGLEVVDRTGSQNNDPIRQTGYQTNHQGGLIGGISTGMPLVLRLGFKPTSTIALSQQSVRKNLSEIDYQLKKGRHDPCLGVRAGVTVESRVAIEVLNAVLAHQARRIDPGQFELF
ncbi:MAG: chorismate synthase [Candidatus Latescibacteria bacterium]|nr:chorismate synthase [Candidatus Latescibacterota bacterium]